MDLVKELGDICWYVALLASGIGCDLENIMVMNIEKLKRDILKDLRLGLHRERENR